MIVIFKAFLLLCVVLLQSWIDLPTMRRQPAIEPLQSKLGKVAGTIGNTGAALPFEYTLGALKNLASGERKNTQMQAISGRLREKEMQAVAEYIAGMRGG